MLALSLFYLCGPPPSPPLVHSLFFYVYASSSLRPFAPSALFSLSTRVTISMEIRPFAPDFFPIGIAARRCARWRALRTRSLEWIRALRARGECGCEVGAGTGSSKIMAGNGAKIQIFAPERLSRFSWEGATLIEIRVSEALFRAVV